MYKDDTIAVSVDLIKSVGRDAAVLFAYLELQSNHMLNLLSLQRYEESKGRWHWDEGKADYRNKAKLIEAGWFPFKPETIDSELGYPTNRQGTCLRKLEERGLIEVRRKGKPGCRCIQFKQ